MFETLFLTVLIGLGGTALLDLWALLLKVLFGQPLPPWHLVGRWFAYMPRGRFVHRAGITAAAPVDHELAIGWLMHYFIGIVFAAIVVLIAGAGWPHHPSFIPALIVGLVTVGAGWYLLQPGMGVGIACSSAPKPNLARLHNIAGHIVFAIGLYGTALLVG